jgi:hypothetical protein
MRLRSAAFAALVPLALVSALLGSTETAQAATSAGSYHALAQTRIVDTRFGVGVPTGKVGPNSTLTFTPLGLGGVPTSDVAAVVFNLTAVVPSAGSFITAYPTGPTKPEVSNLNVDAGVTRANQVTVPVGANGAVSLYNAFGSVDMLVDILGYYDTNGTSGGRYPVVPFRVFDSRTPEDAPALAPSETVTTGFTFDDPTFDPHITALAVNITAIQPDAEGWLSTWDGTVIQPTTSTVNFRAKDIVPNAAIVPVAHTVENGKDYSIIQFRNASSGNTNVAIDVVGVYLDGQTFPDLRFSAITPTRVLDTRFGIGGLTRFGTQETKSAVVPDALLSPEAYGFAGNLTAVTPSGSTYLTIWAQGEDRPNTSTVNSNPGQTVPNAAFVDAAYNVFNAVGTTDVLVDVSGRFDVYDGPTGAGVSAKGMSLLTQRVPTTRPAVRH